MTAVAGTKFTNPGISMTQSNFRLYLNFNHCCVPWGCGVARRHELLGRAYLMPAPLDPYGHRGHSHWGEDTCMCKSTKN